MKFAISGQDTSLASPVACHFGRCCFFHIYDDETGKTEILENCDKDMKQCAGESILHCLIERDVKHIVSADFGTRVQQVMTENEIHMTLLSDCSKCVGDIIRIIQNKKLKKNHVI